MKKTICIVTATRAEWGLLRPLAKQIKDEGIYNLFLAVTGTHFLKEFGNTYQEIIKDGFTINACADILQTPVHNAHEVSAVMARGITGFAKIFAENVIDAVVLLGDRYETLAFAIAAMNARIPICHLHGGEITIGAVDDAIRHAITKLSYLHFTACEEYRQRVIQMGENPDRIYNVGAIGIDNIRQMKLLSKEELAETLQFDLSGHYASVTFHPETLNIEDVQKQCNSLLSALSAFPELKYIITKSNADEGADVINKILDEYAAEHNNVYLVSSLGNLRYLSSLKHASVVIGNSSSGILEAPYFRVPVVNIGLRQEGRIQSKCIINCSADAADIKAAIRKALSPEFNSVAENAEYPYGDGHASEKILAVLHKWLDEDRIDLKKRFYDLEVKE